MKARSFTGARMPLRADQFFRAINSALRSALGRIEEGDHPGRRRRGIVQGFVTGLGSRGVGFLVSFLSVPLTIGYLGKERYGVWILLSSLLAWVRLADLGVSPGLRTAIATALGSGRPDLVRILLSTAFALLCTIAAVVGLVAAVAWPWINWVALFGITTEEARAEVGPAIATSFGFFLLAFPLSITPVTYDALQEGKLQNYWGMAGNIASLVALIIVTHTHGGLVRLVMAISGTGLIVSILSSVWLFARYKPLFAPQPQAVQISSVRRLLNSGGTFFLIQIVALVIFQTGNFIVAKFTGSTNVPSYSLTYTLFSYSYLPQTILFNYLWVAYADAIARRDIGWVARTLKRNLSFSLGFTLAAVVPLILIARPFIQLWTRGAVVPPFDLVYWMAAWSMINAFCSPIACLLAAADHMKAQLVYSALAAAVGIVLSIVLIQSWGVSGVIAGTVISYIIFVCFPCAIDALLLLRKLRNAL
jgi:O-antigen/teichoic acid export membrane protein